MGSSRVEGHGQDHLVLLTRSRTIRNEMLYQPANFPRGFRWACDGRSASNHSGSASRDEAYSAWPWM